MNTIKKTCSKCSSQYELSYVKTTIRDQDSIDCEVCGQQLHRWSEAKVWSAKLIQKQLTPN